MNAPTFTTWKDQMCTTNHRSQAMNMTTECSMDLTRMWSQWPLIRFNWCSHLSSHCQHSLKPKEIFMCLTGVTLLLMSTTTFIMTLLESTGSSQELIINHISIQIMEPTPLQPLVPPSQAISTDSITMITLVISPHLTLREKKIMSCSKSNSDSRFLDNGRQTGIKATTCHPSTIFTKTCPTNNSTPSRSHTCMPTRTP